jgi:3-oxoadipate enol-lactonase
VTLHHRVDGAAGAPVVVLAGSLGTTLELWDEQAAVLATTHRVVRYDHPGHGGSPLPAPPYRVETFARGLLDLLDELAIERFSLCGLSLGGAVAMQVAVLAPERVDLLVLACTSARFGSPGGWLERAKTVRAAGVEAIVDVVFARWFTPPFRAEHAQFCGRFRAMLLATPADGYAACCDAIATWDFRADLSRVDAPTLVLAGADDPSVPVAEVRALVDGISGARLVVLEGAAHLANVEQAESFTAALREHLAGDRGREAA